MNVYYKTCLSKSKTVQSIIFFIFCLSIVSCQTKQPANTQNEKQVTQELISREREWQKAFKRKDNTFISQLLADDFVVTYGDGSRGNKAGEVLEVFGTVEQMESVMEDEFIVKPYDNWAVVMFTSTV